MLKGRRKLARLEGKKTGKATLWRDLKFKEKGDRYWRQDSRVGWKILKEDSSAEERGGKIRVKI